MFLRILYFFGFTNLRDLTDRSVVTFHVVLPLVLGVIYLLIIKGFRFNAPVFMGLIMALVAVSCIFLLANTNGAPVCIAGLFILSALMVLTGLGLIPITMPICVAGIALILYRVLAVDWQFYINPIQSFELIPYLPEASNASCIISMGLLCLSLQITRRKAKNEGTDSQ